MNIFKEFISKIPQLKQRLNMGVLSVLSVSSACLSQAENAGYTHCSPEKACEVGKYCYDSQCFSPAWHLEEATQRRLLSVKNTGTDQMRAGTLLNLSIGGAKENLSSKYFTDGAELFHYRTQDGKPEWLKTKVHSDLFNDHILLWFKLDKNLQSGESTELSWVYSGHENQGTIGTAQAPNNFQKFIKLDTQKTAEKYFSNLGVGTLDFKNGVLNLHDRQQLFYNKALKQPFQVTFKTRISAMNCASVFMGINAEKRNGSPPPYTGFFLAEKFLLSIELAPTTQSTPKAINEIETLDAANITHIYQIKVDKGHLQYYIDGHLYLNYEANDLSFTEEDMYFNIDVDGNGCTVEFFDFRIQEQAISKYQFKLHQKIPYKQF